MQSGVMGGILENRGREKNPGADSGATGGGIDFERAAELGHSFTHAGDADTESGLAAMRNAIGGGGHAAAEVGDFQGDAIGTFAEDDLGTLAAGVALDVGEGFLGDAEEGSFGDLGKTAKTGEKFERSFDAAALAEAVHI